MFLESELHPLVSAFRANIIRVIGFSREQGFARSSRRLAASIVSLEVVGCRLSVVGARGLTSVLPASARSIRHFGPCLTGQRAKEERGYFGSDIWPGCYPSLHPQLQLLQHACYLSPLPKDPDRALFG